MHVNRFGMKLKLLISKIYILSLIAKTKYLFEINWKYLNNRSCYRII